MATTETGTSQQGERSPSTTPLLTALRTALAAALAVPLADYEEDEGEALTPLVDATRAVLDQALAVLDQALRRYDRDAPRTSREPADRNLCRELDRRMVDPASLEKVAGLAYVAQFALRAHAAPLRAATARGASWEVINVCGGALREAQKSLAALEVSVCEVEGLAPARGYFFSELDRSLRVRHAYTAFRRELDVATPPDASSLFARLRRVGTSIAKLVGRSIYPSARIHDRWMVRQLQRRVREWLVRYAAQSEAAGRDALLVAGQRLWGEVANVAELFMQVNHRAELREHDRALLDDALARLAAAPDAGPDARELADLWGRDASLDALLEGREAPRPEAWRRALESLRGRLVDAPAFGEPQRAQRERLSWPQADTLPAAAPGADGDVL